MTKLPPPGANSTVHVTVAVFEVLVKSTAFVTAACTESIPTTKLE